MDGSKQKEKSTRKSNKSKSTGSSDFSSDPSGSKRNEKRRYNDPSSFTDDATSSAYTEASGGSISKSGRYKKSSSFTEGLTSSAYTEGSESGINQKNQFKNSSSLLEEGSSSMYTDPLGRKNNRKMRYRKPSGSMQGATSSAYTDTSGNRSDDKKQQKSPTNFMEGVTSSVYTVNTPGASFQTTGTFTSDLPSDAFSSDQSGEKTTGETVRLMPFKVKDVMEMIKDNPTYKDKSPVMIRVKENDIDQILEKQQIRGKAESLDKYFKQPPRDSPASLPRSLKDKAGSFRMSTGAETGRSKISKESTSRAEKPFIDDPTFAGADRTQKIFAMPDVQAFPVVQTRPSRRRRRSRQLRTPTPRRRVSRQRRPRPRPSVVQPRRPRARRVVRRPMYRRRYVSPCTPFPMCDDNCTVPRPYRPQRINRPVYPEPRRVPSTYNTPYFAEGRTPRQVVSNAYNTPFTASSRGIYYPEKKVVSSVRSRVYYTGSRRVIPRGDCCCNLCEEKLQFIQPGLCSKKKNVWTNEYAVIPKPQVNLIDPCEELDPSIYPRADNPCIRDGQGNPLTDCIGRPLRSPIGKRFLSFTANGSVMETSLRGNFWTGQPPLCVKCPMPSGSCGADTTHNWWMSCGYPIMPNMNPFYKRVLATEFGPC